jgi:hypothetical protein
MEANRAVEARIPLGELESEELKLLDRIDRVNGALHREMHIVHLHQQQRLFNDAQAILPGELRLPFTRFEEFAKPFGSFAGFG